MPTRAVGETSRDELEAEFDRRMADAEERAEAKEAELEQQAADTEAEFDRRMADAEARAEAKEAELERSAAAQEADTDRRMAEAERQAERTAESGAEELRPEGRMSRFLGSFGRGSD